MSEIIGRMGDRDVVLTRYTREDLPDAFRWQILALLRAHWPEDFRHDRQFTTTLFREEWPSWHAVVSAGETVIAHAGFTLLDREFNGETYRVAGLGCVVSFPDYRGEGYGARVVAEASRWIDETDADVAALWCPVHLPPFYQKFGWITLYDAVTTLGDPDHPHVEEEPRSMRFISERGKAAREAFATIPWHLAVRW